MSDELILDKMSLVVTTRCNLRCRLCDEFVPQNRPFPDMTPEEETRILDVLFQVVDHVELLHLSGGGEPFLNPHLADMIHIAFQYRASFGHLMVFTNSTVPVSDKLLNALALYRERIIVHASNYGLTPERSEDTYRLLREHGINLRVIKYYGEDQDYGGWVDFGPWDARGRTEDELAGIFASCGVTKAMHGNWRTRDGTVHWCQRSQRGMELGLLPDCPSDYVDLFSNESREEKRRRFRSIMETRFLSACDHCSGDHGTDDPAKRFPAGQQMKSKEDNLCD